MCKLEADQLICEFHFTCFLNDAARQVIQKIQCVNCSDNDNDDDDDNDDDALDDNGTSISGSPGSL